MRTLISAAALLFSFTCVANASIITWDKQNSFKKKDVELYRSGVIAVGGQTTNLIDFGSGTRSIVIPVYVAQFLSSEAWTTRSEADVMPFVGRSKVIAISLTAKMNLSSSSIEANFRQALKVNNVDQNLPHIQQCIQLIAATTVPKGGHILIAVAKNANGTETMYVEDPAGNLLAPVEGPAGFAQQLFSVWLGVPADSSIRNMKAEVLQGD